MAWKYHITLGYKTPKGDGAMPRISKARKEELEKKTQITGSFLYDYLEMKDALPLAKEIYEMLKSKGFILATCGESNYSSTHNVNHLKFILGNEVERVILTVHKKKE
jgi:hypothetical protein